MGYAGFVGIGQFPETRSQTWKSVQLLQARIRRQSPPPTASCASHNRRNKRSSHNKRNKRSRRSPLRLLTKAKRRIAHAPRPKHGQRSMPTVRPLEQRSIQRHSAALASCGSGCVSAQFSEPACLRPRQAGGCGRKVRDKQQCARCRVNPRVKLAIGDRQNVQRAPADGQAE